MFVSGSRTERGATPWVNHTRPAGATATRSRYRSVIMDAHSVNGPLVFGTRRAIGGGSIGFPGKSSGTTAVTTGVTCVVRGVTGWGGETMRGRVTATVAGENRTTFFAFRSLNHRLTLPGPAGAATRASGHAPGVGRAHFAPPPTNTRSSRAFSRLRVKWSELPSPITSPNGPSPTFRSRTSLETGSSWPIRSRLNSAKYTNPSVPPPIPYGRAFPEGSGHRVSSATCPPATSARARSPVIHSRSTLGRFRPIPSAHHR